jgi:nucleoside-diphosphate-sugar epimerase
MAHNNSIAKNIGNLLSKPTVFVTGASGFIGRFLVQSLLQRNYKVRAGVHNIRKASDIEKNPDLELVEVDICNKNSLKGVFKGVTCLYHLAASLNPKLPADELYFINVEGTRNIWNAARCAGVEKALYCSSTAIYGLLSKNNNITEDEPPRAVEPYGRSKLEGEKIVSQMSANKNLHSIIIRPTAVFGPGERTPFGTALRQAAYSKLLLSAGFQNRYFSYVHVEDVASAAIHLMENNGYHYRVFNIAVNQPVSYEEAFRSYLNALNKAGSKYLKLRLLGRLSLMVERMPKMKHWLNSKKGSRYVFRLWKPGFDRTYSAKRLLSTCYTFRWDNFEDVIKSCIDSEKPMGEFPESNLNSTLAPWVRRISQGHANNLGIFK